MASADFTITTQLVFLVEAQELLNLMSMELKLALSLIAYKPDYNNYTRNKRNR
jgi:hypothetical protein